jgi:uncharacterized membrane protein
MEQYTTNRGRSALAASLIGLAAVGVAVATVRRRSSGAAAARAVNAGVHVHDAITINCPLAQVYRYWRDFENVPRFLSHIKSEITGDRENEAIAWRSIAGSDIQHDGSVRFEHAPGARGTEVHIALQYHPRGGAFGQAMARLFGNDPEQQIRHDLRRFKQLIETGEIPISDGPGLWRPAQPPERPEELKAHMGVLR